jgi:peptide chain release factor subunit 1
MLAESDLRLLLEFSKKKPVLSVYLNTDPSQGNADAYKLRLRNMLKGIHLPEDVRAIERYFNLEFNWSGKGVAVFSCAEAGFFNAYPLALPVRDMVQISDRPSVKPLANLFNTYGGYGVVLVDKQGARLFFFHLGQLKEQQGVLGEPVKHTKHGGASSLAGRRGGIAGQTNFVEETIERNMKEVVDTAVHFFEENHVRRVLIGGTEDNIALFRSLLNKTWQSLIVGTFHMNMTATHTEVLNQTLQIGVQVEAQHEKKIVENLVSGAAKNGAAVTGLEATLVAINDGRVQMLVLVENLKKRGYRCQECNRLTTLLSETCEGCSGKLEKIPDILELAVSTVMRQGGEVEVIQPLPELEQAGGIGALLRY